jgi:hypothetical protein
VVHHPDAEKKTHYKDVYLSLMINSTDYIQPPSPDLLLDPNFDNNLIQVAEEEKKSNFIFWDPLLLGNQVNISVCSIGSPKLQVASQYEVMLATFITLYSR